MVINQKRLQPLGFLGLLAFLGSGREDLRHSLLQLLLSSTDLHQQHTLGVHNLVDHLDGSRATRALNSALNARLFRFMVL